MRTTLAILCLVGFLAGCERRGDRAATAELDRSSADTVASGMALGATADTAALEWSTEVPGFPSGIRRAVLQGDPSQPGPFTLRLDMPNGYEVRPHYHPVSEQVRILEGAVVMGRGKEWDEKKLESLAAGAGTSIPAQEPHYVRAKERTLLEVKSTGPFRITYVNPADDPRNKPIP